MVIKVQCTFGRLKLREHPFGGHGATLSCLKRIAGWVRCHGVLRPLFDRLKYIASKLKPMK